MTGGLLHGPGGMEITRGLLRRRMQYRPLVKLIRL